MKIGKIDGQKTAGKVVGFTSKHDNDSGVPTIDIASDKFNACVSIGENEILSIEQSKL